MSHEARLKIVKQELKCSLDRRARPVTDLMCIAVEGGKVAVGSGQGWVFVYREGQTTPFYEKQLSDGMRTCSVSFDKTGELLLAATVAGKITLIDFAEGASERTYQHKAQIQSAAIDPDARTKTGISCVFCDTNGVVWRIRPKSSSLFKSSDTDVSEHIWKGKGLDTIVWKGDIIAWNTENGQTEEVRMYRPSAGQMIKSAIKPERLSTCPHIRYPRCSFVVTSPDSMTVLANGSQYEVELPSGAWKRVGDPQPVYLMARNGSMTAKLMVLGGSRKATFEISRGSSEVCRDEIAGEFEESKQMALQPAGNEGFYVMFTDQVYYVKILSNDEKVDYYLSIDNIEQCLATFREIAKSGKSDEQKRQLIMKILDHLNKKGDDTRMAQVCSEFASNSDWPELIQYFSQIGKFEIVAGIVPLESVQLDKAVVTDILQVLIRRNEARFLEVFTKLNPDSFTAVKLVGDVQRRYEDDPKFAGALMTIEHKLGEHEKAFRTALDMRYPGFFDDIVRFNQYKFLLNEFNLKQIMEKYPGTFADFLKQHVEQLDPSTILGLMNSVLADVNKQMEVNPETAEADLKVIEQFKLGYLDKLRQIEHPVLLEERWGTELAIMYIKFNSPETMKYLETSASFKLMPVREAAEEHGMYKEAAFLCQKAGDLAGGMNIYLEHIPDPQEALRFAKECDKGGNKDKEMWKLLTTYSYQHPEFLRAILMDLPNLKIKPVKFIKGIPDTNIIPDFEQLAARTVKEYKRKERTLDLAQRIVATDAFGAFSRRLDAYKAGKLQPF